MTATWPWTLRHVDGLWVTTHLDCGTPSPGFGSMSDLRDWRTRHTCPDKEKP